MISEVRRDEIRRTHRANWPAVRPTRCTGCFQNFPCDAIQLLDDLEQVEAAARTARSEQQQKLLDLQARNNELEAKIMRAVRDLS